MHWILRIKLFLLYSIPGSETLIYVVDWAYMLIYVVYYNDPNSHICSILKIELGFLEVSLTLIFNLGKFFLKPYQVQGSGSHCEFTDWQHVHLCVIIFKL